MDRAVLQEHLQLAESHVVLGIRHIAQQRELIRQLQGQGNETAQAVKLLTTFEEAQALHVADRDRLRSELSRSDL